MQEAFDHAAQGRTVIAVAHRLASIKGYDKIIVMRSGQVIEEGTHESLLDSKGAYYALAATQQGSPKKGTDGEESDDVSSNEGEAEPVSSSSSSEKALVEQPSEVIESRKGVPSGEDASDADAEINPRSKRPGLVPRLLVMCRSQLAFALIGLLTSGIIGAAYSGEAFIFGHVINALNPCRGIPAIRSSGDFFALMFFVLALVEFSAYTINGSSFGKMAEKLLYRLRRLCFLALLKQKQSWFDEEGRSPSTIVSALATEASALGGLTSTVLGTVFAIAVNLVVGLIVSLIVNWRIAIVLIWMVPLMMAAGYMRLKVLADFQRRHATAYRGANAIAIEAFNNIITVQGLGCESDVSDRFEHSLLQPYRAGLKQIIVGNVFLAAALSLS